MAPYSSSPIRKESNRRELRENQSHDDGINVGSSPSHSLLATPSRRFAMLLHESIESLYKS
jgi:hypothetical protein